MKIFLLLLFAAVGSTFANEGRSLTVTVTNIPGPKGDLLVGLYDSAKSFTGTPLPGSKKIPLKKSGGSVKTTFTGLKPGTYAVAVIQDLNGNGVLDRNAVGMPEEPLAFSVIKKIPWGKPKFAACSFEVADKDVAMTIPLVLE